MTELTAKQPATRSFWIISSLALIWNLIGVASYLSTVTITPEALAEMSEAERALNTDMPNWVKSVFAIAVFSGVLGCIALLMRKAFSIPLLVISLAAIVAQVTYNVFISDAMAVYGPTAIILPILLVGIGAYLVWYSSNAKKKGVLN